MPTLQENVIVLAVPTRYVKATATEKARLQFSAVLSLYGTSEDWPDTAVNKSHDIYVNSTKYFKDWVQQAGLPWGGATTADGPVSLPQIEVTLKKNGYKAAMKKLDGEIAVINTKLQTETDPAKKDALQKELQEKTKELLELTTEMKLDADDPAFATFGAPRLDKTRLKTISPRSSPAPVAAAATTVGPAHSRALWQVLFGPQNEATGCWIYPQKPHAEGTAKADTATDPDALRSVLRGSSRSIEGITSDEMNALVASGLAMESVTARPAPKQMKKAGEDDDTPAAGALKAAQIEPYKVPQNAQGIWYGALERMDQVIERQNQLGAAGGESEAYTRETQTTVAGSEPMTPEQKNQAEARLGQEFHHRLAAVDDHPDLLRMLGLIVDLEVDLEGDLPFLELEADGSRMIDLTLKLTIKALPGLNCKAFTTACVLHQDAAGEISFYAFSRSERLLTREKCVDARSLDTVQWDLESGVRNVLRRNGYQNGLSRETGGSAPGGYGISVFWSEQDRAQFLNAQKKQINSAAAELGGSDVFDKLETHGLMAEDLVLGYVPSIGVHSNWHSLTRRALRLKVPQTQTAGGILPEFDLVWSDEMALSSSMIEAPQPLAGWLVDVLKADLPALVIPPGAVDPAPRLEQWYYLLSTLAGFVVVHEQVWVQHFKEDARRPQRVQDKDEKNGSTLWQMLFWKDKQGEIQHHLGQYVELQGMRITTEGVFHATNATVKMGDGLAGRVQSHTNIEVIDLAPQAGPPAPGGPRVPGLCLVKIPVERRLAPTFLSAPSQPGANPTLTFAYLRGSFIVQKLKEKVKALGGDDLHLFFQGRGSRSLVVMDYMEQEAGKTVSISRSEVLSLPAEGFSMRFVSKEDHVLTFRMEDSGLDAAVEERTRDVRIKLAANGKISTLVDPDTSNTDVLSPGSLYHVIAVLNTDPQQPERSVIEARQILEVSPAYLAMFDRMEFGDGKKVVAIFRQFGSASGSEIRCEVDPLQTLIIFTHVSQAAGSFSTASPATAEIPKPGPTSSAGNWEEMAVHLAPNDQCKLFLTRVAPDAGTQAGRYVLRRLEVSDAPGAETFYALGMPHGSHAGAGVDWEKTFPVIPLVAASQDSVPPPAVRIIELTDQTEIVAVPVALPPTKRWRTWNSPPDGALMRISQENAGSNVSRRIEVMNRLETTVSDSAIVPTTPLTKLKVNLPRSAAFHELPVHRFIGNPAAPDSQAGPEVQAFCTLMLSYLPKSKVTLHLDSRGVISRIILPVPGQPASAPQDWKPDIGPAFVIPPQIKGNADLTTGDTLMVSLFVNQSADAAPQLQASVATLTRVPDSHATTVQLSDLFVKFDQAAANQQPNVLYQEATVTVLTAATEIKAELPPTTNSLPLMVEVRPLPGKEFDDPALNDRRNQYYRLLAAANESAFPLEAKALVALFIDEAEKPGTDWEILALPLKGGPDTTKPKNQTDIKADGVPTWIRQVEKVAHTLSSDVVTLDAEREVSFEVVLVPAAGTQPATVPLFSGVIPMVAAAVEDPHFRPNDQIVADDVIMHWNGWSLAVDPPQRAKQKREQEEKTLALAAQPDNPNATDEEKRLKAEAVLQRTRILAQRNSPLNVQASLAPPSNPPKPEEMLPPCRVGSEYKVCMRVMQVSGDVRSLKGLDGVKQGILPFAPFGKAFGRQEEGQPAPSSKLLRFEPTGAPLVWQSSPSVLPLPSAAAKPDPSNMSPAFVKEVNLLTKRSETKVRGESATSGEVQLSFYPPPIHWHSAEILGGFDDSPANAWQQIVSGLDWQIIGKDTSVWKTPPTTLVWPEMVADPDVGAVLITTPNEHLYLNVAKGKVSKLSLRRGADQVANNPDPNRVPVPPSLDVSSFDKQTSLTVPEDADWQIRIYGIPSVKKLGAILKSKETAHFVSTFAEQAATHGGLVDALQTLGKCQEDTSLDSASAQEDFKGLTDLLRAYALRASKDGNPAPDSAFVTDQLLPFLMHPWVSTPRVIRLRHITNQPSQPPALMKLEMAARMPGQTDALYKSIFHLHRPSTGSLTLQAALEQEYIDDERAALPAVPDEELVRILEDPVLRKQASDRIFARAVDLRRHMDEIDRASRLSEQETASAGAAAPAALEKGGGLSAATLGTTKKAPPHHDVVYLGRTVPDLEKNLSRPPLDLTFITPTTNLYISDQGPDEEHFEFKQEFQDTRHRTVFYRGIAHTRFGKAPAPEGFGEKGVETNPMTISKMEHSDSWKLVEVPATVPPKDIVSRDITTIQKWSGGEASDAKMWERAGTHWQFSRTRSSGHRIWIERPWYSSGSGEKVAVLLWMDSHVSWAEGQEYLNLVSRWAPDGVFETTLPASRDEWETEKGIGLLTRKDFLDTWAAPLGLRSRPIRPDDQEGEEAVAGLPTAEGKMLPVGLVAYSPRFHPEYQRWYVDVFVKQPCYSPFLSFTIARYQPCSIPECALSNPLRLRPLQALPERTLTLTARRTPLVEIEVTLAGIFPPQNHRRITVTVECNPYLEDKRMENDEDSLEKQHLGWQPIQILDEEGRSDLAVKVVDPVSTTPGRPLRSVRIPVRIPGIPLHHSRWADRQGPRPDGLVSWPCRYLRITVAEDELFPCAHGMPEDQREAPRRVYTDQVLLPEALLQAHSADVNHEKKNKVSATAGAASALAPY